MKQGKDLFPIFRGFRDILLAERQRLSLHIQNMTLFLGSENRAESSILAVERVVSHGGSEPLFRKRKSTDATFGRRIWSL